MVLRALRLELPSDVLVSEEDVVLLLQKQNINKCHPVFAQDVLHHIRAEQHAQKMRAFRTGEDGEGIALVEAVTYSMSINSEELNDTIYKLLYGKYGKSLDREWDRKLVRQINLVRPETKISFVSRWASNIKSDLLKLVNSLRINRVNQ